MKESFFEKKEQPVDIEQAKKEYMDKLIKGRPDEARERRERMYKGNLDKLKEISESEKAGAKENLNISGQGEEIDVDAFKAAYNKWLIKPEGPKPEPKDFAK